MILTVQYAGTAFRKSALFSQSHTYYIEMACNKQNGAGSGSEIAPPLPNQAFTLNRAGVAVINVPCEKLYRDIEVLHSFAEVGVRWW